MVREWAIDGLLQGLVQQGYQAQAITDLRMLTLLQYDVVYLSDMHGPGHSHADWRKTLTQFVRDGGSVLQTWHHHVLSEVGVGVERIYNSRRMHVKPGHPAVAGVEDFECFYKDHIIEKVGKAGTVLLVNDAGQPVAVAGKIGNGKVISTGLALAIPGGSVSRPPRGPELKLLKAFLGWLEPDIPQGQRLDEALKTTTLEVSPAKSQVAAGFAARFVARVGTIAAEAAQVTCEGAEVRPIKTLTSPVGPGKLSVFEVTVPTPAGTEQRLARTIRAKIGACTLEEKIQVSGIYAAPPKQEVRGVWLHVGKDRHPKEVMPELKRLGINMVVLRIAGGTAAFYASKVQPDIQDPLAPDGDWLAEAVKHAHANEIEIHPYVNNCVVEGRTSKQSLEQLAKAGRLQQAANGDTISWFCPSQEANLAAMERVMLEIATQYDVDGVQYDFIRYPNSRGCFCPKCRAEFEKQTGRPVADWPGEVTTGTRHAEWVEFRCDRISALVRRISTAIRQKAPKVRISAAVFTTWPGCRESVGQDWVRWCREGWLDFVCPMNYTLDATEFAQRAEVHRQALPKDFPMVQGIGIASGQGRMRDASELALQIMLARKLEAAGFVGFCYQPQHTQQLLKRGRSSF